MTVPAPLVMTSTWVHGPMVRPTSTPAPQALVLFDHLINEAILPALV
jgi:hypothetical protein